MKKQIDIIRKTRHYLLDSVSGLSIDDINKVPDGFNNNILWNMGHMVAAQQGICYKRAGLDTITENHFFETYKPGTKPEQFIGLAESERIKQLLDSTLDRFEEDYEANLFTGYTAWTSRYNIEIQNIEDAIAFLPIHEGMHLGYIMALKRAINR